MIIGITSRRGREACRVLTWTSLDVGWWAPCSSPGNRRELLTSDATNALDVRVGCDTIIGHGGWQKYEPAEKFAEFSSTYICYA